MNYLSVTEAARYANCHPETIRDALRGGKLHGLQRTKRGSWKVRADWIDSWLNGEAVAA